jgi:hypothetical protein
VAGCGDTAVVSTYKDRRSGRGTVLEMLGNEMGKRRGIEGVLLVNQSLVHVAG